MASLRSRFCLKNFRYVSRRYNHSAAPRSVAQLLATTPDDSTVTVNGYINSVRKQKKMCFASIGDGSSLEPLQALLTPEQGASLTNGTAVRLCGTWTTSPNPSKQSSELKVSSLQVLGPSDAATFPIQKKYQTVDYLRSMPHLRGRVPSAAMLLRFRSECIAEVTTFFSQIGYVQTHPPVITSSDCEGAGEVFTILTEEDKAQIGKEDGTVPFFRSPKYLTVSTQLHLEALAQSVGKVWTLAPTFRAEKSDTPRHLSEFYMLEAEVNFVDDMAQVMDLIEDMLRHLATSISQKPIYDELLHGRRSNEDSGNLSADEFTTLLKTRWSGMKKSSWPRITYTEAIRILQDSGETFEHTPEWGAGLQSEHEKYIATKVGAGSPVFVTHYPQAIKAFYMLPTAGAHPSRATVDCFDLLVPDTCEIVGGSMREYRYDELLEVMRRNNLTKPTTMESGEIVEDLGSLQWYADLRKWGSVPHGGFGLGFDRLICYLAGVNSIRETVAFPRWVGRCDC